MVRRNFGSGSRLTLTFLLACSNPWQGPNTSCFPDYNSHTEDAGGGEGQFNGEINKMKTIFIISNQFLGQGATISTFPITADAHWNWCLQFFIAFPFPVSSRDPIVLLVQPSQLPQPDSRGATRLAICCLERHLHYCQICLNQLPSPSPNCCKIVQNLVHKKLVDCEIFDKLIVWVGIWATPLLTFNL